MKCSPSTLAVFFCAATTLAGGLAFAQDKSTVASDPLGKFVGNGTCTGNVLATRGHPGHASTGKYHGEKILDGRWVEIHYDEDQTVVNPKPFRIVQYFGYDATSKRYLTVSVDNMSGGYTTGTSAGWKAGSITFDESESGKPASSRDIFTSDDAGLSSHTGMMLDKNGKWIKTDEETCKRG